MKKYTLILMALISFYSCRADEDIHNNPHTNIDIVNAVLDDDIKTVKALLAEGQDVETKGERDRTLLLLATYNNNVEIAKLLLDAGANVNTQDAIQDSPFLYAGAEGKFELVKLYLNYNPDFNLYNRYGGTGLIPAAEKRHPEVVELLANTTNYPIDHVNNLGWTALMEAIVLGSQSSTQTRIVQILVDAGVDINIPDSKGVSALTHARNRGYTDIVKILEKASSLK